MPRPKRFDLPGIPQHVGQRGNNRQLVVPHATYLALGATPEARLCAYRELIRDALDPDTEAWIRSALEHNNVVGAATISPQRSSV